MRLLLPSLAALCAAFFVYGCQSDPPAPNASNATGSESAQRNANGALTEEVIYLVMVDKLNLREEPSKSAKVIAQFPEGALVTGQGEVSANKEQVTLRGMIYNEGYAKVKGYSASGAAGWAYNGALQKIYIGQAANRPDTAQLTAFNTFLRGLDSKQIGSGKKLWDYLAEHAPQGSLADAFYVLSERFLKRMELEGAYYKVTENMRWSNKDMEDISKHLYQYKNPSTRIFQENGFRLETAEGMVFPVPDPVRLHDFFAPKVTPSMKRYLDQKLIESNEQAWNDGGIILPLDQLAERSIFWETFNRDNPGFLLSQETADSERWLRNSLLIGSDNTPAFTYENMQVDSEYQKIWKTILEKYPGTKLAEEVKKFSDLVAAEGNKRTEKVEKYISDHLINQ